MPTSALFSGTKARDGPSKQVGLVKTTNGSGKSGRKTQNPYGQRAQRTDLTPPSNQSRGNGTSSMAGQLPLSQTAKSHGHSPKKAQKEQPLLRSQIQMGPICTPSVLTRTVSPEDTSRAKATGKERGSCFSAWIATVSSGVAVSSHGKGIPPTNCFNLQTALRQSPQT